ncbi:MAG: hypothetical protein H7145_07340 [Akkermansiaceae bacterium]|nr:hypothetical protein [Armatimonadota bacterium]
MNFYNTSVSDTSLFDYAVTGITNATANPKFTGVTSTTGFNRVVITGLQTSTAAPNATYPAYPNAAFIALDQVEMGQFQPVPAPPAAISLGIGGLVGLLGTGAGKLRARRKRTAKKV